MKIRKIEPNDNTAMAKIIRNSLEEFNAVKQGTVYFDEATDHLSDIFSEARSAYFVIEIEGELAGGAGIFPTKELADDTCELVKMYLAKKFRGNGYGKILLEKCINRAKEEGYVKMYIETMPELSNALEMYRKNGFEYISHSLGNSGHTGCELWMIKTIN
ncbi:MAG: GNAT family N-acetyltransferase [Ginsengibacter sp.]